ncbi:MAG: cupin domain-containing protein [Candidatus Bipolaricaulota bacterium]
MKIQHLVLDNDVHKALKARKKKVGVTVKEIGNSALRAALLVPTRQELIVEKLVETGKITRKDYDQAAAAANRALKSAYTKTGEEVTPPPDGSPMTIGSWQGKMIHLSSDGVFHMFVHRARDGKKTSSSMHQHSEAHSWTLVVQGKVLCRIGKEERILGASEAVHIPPEVPHNSAPLTRNTVMLTLMSPPEQSTRDALGAPKAKKPRTRRIKGGGR